MILVLSLSVASLRSVGILCSLSRAAPSSSSLALEARNLGYSDQLNPKIQPLYLQYDSSSSLLCSLSGGWKNDQKNFIVLIMKESFDVVLSISN